MGKDMQTTGSRRQVWNRNAKKTSGGLKRDDLFQDKYGNIKSRKASKKAKKSKNLRKAGWTFKKGSFGAVKLSDAKKKKKSSKGTKKRGKSSKKRKGSRKRGGTGCDPRRQRGGNGCGSNPEGSR
tara:strand:- start:1029 stop:1403 length:375 start_codon:yes stop_codon:yes gene_type:complete